jgi:uncharacterized protein involved in exopolysaccharide biosynthesis
VDPTALPSVAMTASQELELARQELTRLERRLTDQHPDIQRLIRLIARLEEQVTAEAGTAHAGDGPTPAAPSVATPQELDRRDRLQQMRAEIESLDRQIAFKDSEAKRLRSTVADYQRRIESVPGIETEWVALTRDYDTLQETYRDLLAKSEASKVAADLEHRQIGEQFRVLEPARVPLRPASSVRLYVNGGGLGAGLLLGLAVVALLELRDTSFRSEEDVLGALGLPVVALVPYLQTKADRTRRRWHAFWIAVVVLMGTAAGGYLVWTMKLWMFIV